MRKRSGCFRCGAQGAETISHTAKPQQTKAILAWRIWLVQCLFFTTRSCSERSASNRNTCAKRSPKVAWRSSGYYLRSIGWDSTLPNHRNKPRAREVYAALFHLSSENNRTTQLHDLRAHHCRRPSEPIFEWSLAAELVLGRAIRSLAPGLARRPGTVDRRYRPRED
jgi:hypothetical protein